MNTELPRFCIELSCLKDAQCLSCERCIEHCINAVGCDYKPLGQPDPVLGAADFGLVSIDALTFFGFPEEEKTDPAARPTRETCLGCHREMSSTLDAYYGTDDYWGRYCAPCREKRLAKK